MSQTQVMQANFKTQHWIDKPVEHFSQKINPTYPKK